MADVLVLWVLCYLGFGFGIWIIRSIGRRGLRAWAESKMHQLVPWRGVWHLDTRLLARLGAATGMPKVQMPVRMAAERHSTHIASTT